KQYPFADLKLEQKWWVGAERGFSLLRALPKKTSVWVNAVFAKLIRDMSAPESVADGHRCSTRAPEVVERFEDAFFVKHEAQFAEVHRQLQDVGLLPGCAGGMC
ncbi:hypothetical protein N657DRAFT_579855, partial [Parathielavia appendiculata]